MPVVPSVFDGPEKNYPWRKTFDTKTDLFIVTLLLLHLLELRVDVLGQVVDRDPVLLYGVILLLMSGFVIVEFVVYFIDFFACFVMSLESLVLLGLDQVVN